MLSFMKKRRKKAPTLVLTGMTSAEFLKLSKQVRHMVLESFDGVPELSWRYLCKRWKPSKASRTSRKPQHTKDPIAGSANREQGCRSCFPALPGVLRSLLLVRP